MERILSFTDKTEVLTIDELYASCKLKNADGKHIVEPHRVYSDTLELMGKHNIGFEILPIIAKGGTHALYNEDLASYIGTPNHIKAYTLLRTSGIITFPEFNNNETTMQLRIDVTERGITLSTGKLVLVCTNGMTAFKGDICATYGQGKIQYDHALQVVENWIMNMRTNSERYDKMIATMKAIPVQQNETQTMIGKLMYQAVKGNMDNFVAPMNITQVSSFTNSYIEKLKNEERIATVWDLYNIGTDLFKHDTMDMTIIAERNFNFSQFILNDYCINAEDAVIVE